MIKALTRKMNFIAVSLIHNKKNLREARHIVIMTIPQKQYDVYLRAEIEVEWSGVE